MSLVRTFELEVWGGGAERRYRKLRPEVLAMPWGSLATLELSDASRLLARRVFTFMAFQEQRTGLACARLLEAMLMANAPIDLVAAAAPFPLDEMVHTELCARTAMELGGGTEILVEEDPGGSSNEGKPSNEPEDARALLRVALRAVSAFCVGEALSFPLLRANWHYASHPLTRAVFGQLVKDEASHGAIGFTLLDWVLPELGAEEIALVAEAARGAIEVMRGSWVGVLEGPRLEEREARGLGLLMPERYLEIASGALEAQVIAPLRARGVEV